MVGGPEQHRLAFERQPRFAVLQDAPDHIVDLTQLVLHRGEEGLLLRAAGRAQLLPVLLAGLHDHGIGCVQDRLHRAVVLLEGDDPGRGLEQAREVQDVAHRGTPEGVDRLRVVPDHRHAVPVGLHPKQDRGLQRVGVLVLVHQHEVEAAAHIGSDLRRSQHSLPPEQQVVIVEHALVLLGGDIGGEQALELVVPLSTPREGVAQHRQERLLRVDGAGVDREAGGLAREAAIGAGETQLVAYKVDQVGSITAVEDGEGRVEADHGRVEAQ